MARVKAKNQNITYTPPNPKKKKGKFLGKTVEAASSKDAAPSLKSGLAAKTSQPSAFYSAGKASQAGFEALKNSLTFSYNAFSYPVKAACWSTRKAWSLTPEPLKAPIRYAGGIAKTAAQIAALSLAYKGYKYAVPFVSQVKETVAASQASAVMNYAVTPAIEWVAPAAAAVAAQVTEVVKEALVETATDALQGAGPLVAQGSLAVTRQAISGSSSLALGVANGAWTVLNNLDYTTYAYFGGAVTLGLFTKYYAMPAVRKLCTGVPLPSWIWKGDARLVTPFSRMLQSVKNWVWKSRAAEPILNEDVKTRVETIISANNNILKNKGFFKNILLFGKPGTGKTMLAEKIARDSGFNFIKISGGELAWVIPSGNAVKLLNELIQFARDSFYPTVFIIDEIDAICPNSDACRNSKATRQEKEFRSALLSATGSSQKLLIIGTTNHEHDIDPGLLSRLNNRIEMKLPNQESRAKILTQYIDRLLGKIPERLSKERPENKADSTESEIDYTDCLTEKCIEDLAKATDGMSGRTLFQFVDSLKMQRPCSPDGLLTRGAVKEILRCYLDDLERDRKAKRDRLAQLQEEWNTSLGLPTQPTAAAPEKKATELSSKVEALHAKIASLEEAFSAIKKDLAVPIGAEKGAAPSIPLNQATQAAE